MSNQRKILHDDRNGLDYVWVLGNASKRIYEKL